MPSQSQSRAIAKQSKIIAKALLDIKAVGFAPQKPITFKSGMLSPIYVDNRVFPYYPKQWRRVINAFMSLISDQQLDFQVIAGIETAGIPHSATLGYTLKKPSVFVRKKIKDHGTKSRVEGGDVKGQTVLLIEDHVTTGGSSLAGVEALRAEGARVKDCLCITAYGFNQGKKAFKKAGVKLHSLTTFKVILTQALGRKLFTLSQKKLIEDWLSDPWDWTKKFKQKKLVGR
jgi:orotate phosphoribosyltransferase